MSGVRNNNNMVEKFNNGGSVYREPWQKHSRNISAISAVSDISASNAEPLKGRLDSSVEYSTIWTRIRIIHCRYCPIVNLIFGQSPKYMVIEYTQFAL